MSGDERVLWTGKPNPRVVFHPSDWYMIPFGLMVGAFTLFWEAAVGGPFEKSRANHAPDFMILLGIPFVLFGQYVIWGRFFHAAWSKKRILYAITNRRVLVIFRGIRLKVISAFLGALPPIEKELREDGIGTLKFGPVPSPISAWSGRGNNMLMDGLYLNSGVPVFVDIDDADSAYKVVADHRAYSDQNL